jgi:hypothetical protein
MDTYKIKMNLINYNLFQILIKSAAKILKMISIILYKSLKIILYINNLL